jgi:hypothetical protein
MPQEVLEELDSFAADANSTNVLMVAEEDGEAVSDIPYEVQRLSMKSQLGERFRKIVRENLTSEVVEHRLIEYTTSYKLDRQELFYVDLDEAEDLASTLNFIESVTDPEVFSRSDDFASRMSFYSIVLQDVDGDKATFYRKHTSRNALSRGLLTRAVDQDTFDELESQAYLFDEKVDFFTWENYLFIRSAYNFRLVFDRFEKIQQEASENAKKVAETIPIWNDKDFIKACQNQPQMVSKVSQVVKQPYIDDIEMDDVKKTVDEFGLDLKIQEVNGQEQIIFESDVESRWIILKMLDDDYLGSVMTDRKYEANSKRSMGG